MRPIRRAVTGCVLAAALAGCSSAPAAEPPPPATTSTAADPVASAAALAKANAAVSTALAALSAAERTLNADYAWVREANDVGKKAPDKVLLWPQERKVLSAAHGRAVGGINAARTAAKMRPADCSAVRANKSIISSAASAGASSLERIDGLAARGTAALKKAPAHRAAVQRALANLQKVEKANPQATVPTNLETLLATAHNAGEQKSLTDAVTRTKDAAAASVAEINRLARASRNIAGYCG